MTSYKKYGSNSSYFKTEDVLHQSLKLRIEGVAPETFTFDGVDEEKLVVSFVDVEKQLSLNKVNAQKLEELSGSEHIEEWKGLEIILYADDTMFGGKPMKGMRIRSANQQAAPIVDTTQKAAAYSEPIKETDYANGEVDEADIPF